MKLKKWEWLIIAGVIAICFGIAWAVDEAVTVSFTAVGPTASKCTNASKAILYIETADVWATFDGVTTPTSAGVGIRLSKETIYTDILTSNTDITNLKMVRSSGGVDAKAHLAYKWATSLP